MVESGSETVARCWRRSLVADVVLTTLPLLVVPPVVLFGLPSLPVVGIPIGYVLGGFVAGYAVDARGVVGLPVLALVPIVHVAVFAARGAIASGRYSIRPPSANW